MRRTFLELDNPQARFLTVEELVTHSTLIITSGVATSIVMPILTNWATGPLLEIFNGGTGDLTLTGGEFWHGAPLADTASVVVKSGEWCDLFWHGAQQRWMVKAATVPAPGLVAEPAGAVPARSHHSHADQAAAAGRKAVREVGHED